jgi:hypothetical protein
MEAVPEIVKEFRMYEDTSFSVYGTLLTDGRMFIHWDRAKKPVTVSEVKYFLARLGDVKRALVKKGFTSLYLLEAESDTRFASLLGFQTVGSLGEKIVMKVDL